MKITLIMLWILGTAQLTWYGDFNLARKQATKSHRMILLNFSGSDWCGPCIRLRKEILESASFANFAADHLVLVRADFPREKKNMPDAEQVKRNELLADQYNKEGKFPLTLLLDEHGNVIKVWEGFPGGTPDHFISTISDFETRQDIKSR